MDLINSTPVPAMLGIGKLFSNEDRFGTVTAKATFSFRQGRVELETQKPFPLLGMDERTPLGLIPRDDIPRRDDDLFEVIVLGAAQPEETKPLDARRISLRVGEVERSMLVSSDRSWTSSQEISFHDVDSQEEVALSDERAFGGRALLEVDREAFLEIQDVNNPYGRGFDPELQVGSLGAMLRCPAGYPRCSARRHLPNLESSNDRIRSPGDAPRPTYWSAVPMETGLHATRSLSASDGSRRAAAMFHRAHPDWVIPPPAPGDPIELRGLRAHDDLLRLAVPRLRVWVDYASGARTGTRELVPHFLGLFPGVGRMSVVYRSSFSFDYAEGAERCLRLRLGEHPRRVS